MANKDGGLPDWLLVIIGMCILFVFCSIGYQIYLAGFSEGIANVWAWCCRHPFLSIVLLLVILLSGGANSPTKASDRETPTGESEGLGNDYEVDEGESIPRRTVGYEKLLVGLGLNGKSVHM